MNTEQLKTAQQILEKHSPIFNPLFADDNVRKWKANVVQAMQDFAQQEIQRDRESRWISVKERLPENKIWVIVWIPQRGMSFMAYRAGEMWESDLLGLNTVNTATHWQPLPEPPKL